MTDKRIRQHPILAVPDRQMFEFYWQNQKLAAYAGETIAAALIANGIHVFGHHTKDGSPQGLFCANGQCAQCMVLNENLPIKACIELVKPEMRIEPLEGLPQLSLQYEKLFNKPIEVIDIPVLIIGGGPAGLSAGIELGKSAIKTILIDDKHRLGGKLVLQTHRFFGSKNTVFAGTRGINIATCLEEEIRSFPKVDIWLQSTALAVFSDRAVGILRLSKEYVVVKPQILLVTSGAREKSLAFKGNSLPGIFGAGAFQTLVNRDLVVPSERLFIVGGGNVGLIAGYHALQAGIKVIGLAEVLPECGGYKVHKDKLARMGVPIYTSHTILSANGTDHVESVTIAQVDREFRLIPGTEKSFTCDSVLVAVGLNPVDEFYKKALEFGMVAFTAGDSEEIAEASAAIVSGKIKGSEITKSLNCQPNIISEEWYRLVEILKSKKGGNLPEVLPEVTSGVFPVIHCTQEIPCDPCKYLCTSGLIQIDDQDIRKIPIFVSNDKVCKGCQRCVAGCPGLAIILIDYRRNQNFPTVSIPFEFSKDLIQNKPFVTVLDTRGNELGNVKVQKFFKIPSADNTLIVQVEASKEYACKIAGFRIQDAEVALPMERFIPHIENDSFVCRCERVTAGEIRDLIRNGHRDLNEIKTITRAGMGACGSKTCNDLIFNLFVEEGIPKSDLKDLTKRPLFIEVPLKVLSGSNQEK